MTGMWGSQNFIRKHFAGTQSWGMRVTHALNVLTQYFINFFVTGIYRFGYVGNTFIKYINAQFYEIFLWVHKDGVCSNTCMIKYINAQFYYIFCYRNTKMAYIATHALSILTHNFIIFSVTGTQRWGI